MLLKNPDYLLGNNVAGCYAARSADPEVLRQAAAGGIVISLLAHLLKTKQVDGVFVARTVCHGGTLDYEAVVVTDPKEIGKFGRSAYWDIPVLKQKSSIASFEGTLAVVGLPCHLQALKDIGEKDDNFRKKIKYMIGLFCGGNCEKQLLLRVLEQHRVPLANATAVSFHRQHVKGNLEVEFTDGSITRIPFRQFNVYRMLHFFSKRLCLYCFDHTAEVSDISVGDIFTRRFKNKAEKFSSVICRNEEAEQVFLEFCKVKNIVLEEVPKSEIVLSQKRVIGFRKNITARKAAARLFGIKIKNDLKTPFKLNHFMAGVLFFLNEKISRTSIGRKAIFKVPKPLLYAYIALIKLLNNF